MTAPRPEVVEALVRLMSADAPVDVRMARVAQLAATAAELQAAADGLAAACRAIVDDLRVPTAAPEVPSLLSMTHRQVVELGAALYGRGVALSRLAEQLGDLWAAAPSRTLADVCKVLPTDRLNAIAAQLHSAGIADLDRAGGGTR